MSTLNGAYVWRGKTTLIEVNARLMREREEYDQSPSVAIRRDAALTVAAARRIGRIRGANRRAI